MVLTITEISCLVTAADRDPPRGPRRALAASFASLGLGDPGADNRRVSARIERGAVGGELPVGLGELLAQFPGLGVRLVCLCLSEVSDGRGQPVGAEQTSRRTIRPAAA
jgi:hypothetical protein